MDGILVVGDLHLRRGHEAAGEAAVRAVLAAAARLRGRLAAVVLLGDLLHDHAHLHARPVALCGELLAGLATLVPPGADGGARVVALPGNHDMDSHAVFLPPVHALTSFAHIPGVHVVHRPEVRAVEGVGKVLLLPYVPAGRLADAVRLGLGLPPCADAPAVDAATRALGVRVAFGHQAVRGAVQHGRAHHPAAAREADGAPAADGWPWALSLVSGHIHEPQTVGRVRYVGAVLQTAFGHEEHAPAVHVLRAPWDHTDASLERVPLPGVPVLRTLRVRVDADGCALPPLPEALAAGPGDGVVWRLVVEETAEQGGGHRATRRPDGPVAGWLARAGDRVAAVVVVPLRAAAPVSAAAPGPTPAPDADVVPRFHRAWRARVADPASGLSEPVRRLAAVEVERALAGDN